MESERFLENDSKGGMHMYKNSDKLFLTIKLVQSILRSYGFLLGN